ncbi:hypothetical protein J4440_05365 [Candidatus Woesearchaeota archaeon]|nr:hypothetical protein [Candidatus Woesearchaeota archaeon]
MEIMLEITQKLKDMSDKGLLDNSIAILNLPARNLCNKRAEKVIGDSGNLEQACDGCVTQAIRNDGTLSLQRIKKIIDYFATNYETKFITINGRGDPFHPNIRQETLEKINYAYKNGIKSYIFTAGNNLDITLSEFLAEHEVNVMISLFGNKFIDAEFFNKKKYFHRIRPLQNEAEIAANLRNLINYYRTSKRQPKQGTTRIGMNYVVSETDLKDERKLRLLKEAANGNKIFFVCNTNFTKHPNEEIQIKLERIANFYSNFNLKHTTDVYGKCQMGAGSSATADYNGMLLRCPYMDNKEGNGKIQNLTEIRIQKVLKSYMEDRKYSCVMRKHER